MIRKLQIKFVGVNMGFLLVVFLVVMLTLNMYMSGINKRQADVILREVAEHDGISFIGRSRPPESAPPMIFARIFYVKLNKDAAVLDVNCDMMFEFTEEEAATHALAVLQNAKNTGAYADYRYLVAQKDYGSIVVFVENSREMRILRQLIRVSTVVTGITCVLLFGFSVFLSRWMTGPVKDAFERQRRFIADASHELKTPLTVISANTDVLENEIGRNPRLTRMREQSERMGSLITDLISLARTDEGQNQTVAEEFDLSQAVLSAALEFESRAFEEGKTFECDIADGMRHTGDERQLRQVVSILADNAVKHSGAGDRIKISLTREKEKKILSVFNTGAGVDESEYKKIFERFYRSDASRSRQTGGYGLGLAIADSIIKQHKGRISVSGQKGEWIKFTVTL